MIQAATEERLEHLAGTISEATKFLLPRDTSAYYISYTRASREEWGPYAAGTAVLIPHILMEHVSDAIWLAEGVRPVPVLAFDVEEAQFPAVRAIHELMPAGAAWSGAAVGEPSS